MTEDQYSEKWAWVCPNCGSDVRKIKEGMYKCDLDFDEFNYCYTGCGQTSKINEEGLLVKA